MEHKTADHPQAVQDYIDSMLEDFENDHPGTAEALRLHNDAMKRYAPAALALVPRVVRTTIAHTSQLPPLTRVALDGSLDFFGADGC